MRTTDVVSTQDVNSGDVRQDPNKHGAVTDLPLLAQTPPHVPGHDIKKELLDQSIQGDTTQQEISALMQMELEETQDDESIKNDLMKLQTNQMRPRDLVGKVSSAVKSRMSSVRGEQADIDVVEEETEQPEEAMQYSDDDQQLQTFSTSERLNEI